MNTKVRYLPYFKGVYHTSRVFTILEWFKHSRLRMHIWCVWFILCMEQYIMPWWPPNLWFQEVNLIQVCHTIQTHANPIINTIPRPACCLRSFHFKSASIEATNTQMKTGNPYHKDSEKSNSHEVINFYIIEAFCRWNWPSADKLWHWNALTENYADGFCSVWCV